MAKTTACIAATLTALLFFAGVTFAEQTPSPDPPQESVSVPAFHKDSHLTDNWTLASSATASKKMLIVVTLAQPTHRQACHLQSVTPDQLVCKGSFGTTRRYKPQEIAALILPGDNDVRLRIVIGLNAASGLAAWGTYVLAPACLPCAIATGVVATALFFANGAILMADDQPKTLLYLAQGQTLRIKFH